MEEEINEQDRLARKNNVRISGIEETEREDVGEVVAQLFREKFEEGVKPKHCYRVSRFGWNSGRTKR